MTPFPEFKTITVSGLHPKVGKTLLACHIISALQQGVCAVKITMHDGEAKVISDDELLMVEGRDTFRLKSSGAQKVLWIQTDESKLGETFFQAEALVKGFKFLVIEGNSILRHISPCLAVFICDEKIKDISKTKPSRLEAISKADLIIFNWFSEDMELIKSAEEKCMKMNKKADYVRLKLTEKENTVKFLRSYLQKKGFLINP